MIRVARGREPEGFAEQAAAWLQHFRGEQRNNNVTLSQYWARIRSSRPAKQYADQLYAACHHKCAFCESKPESTSHLHVEHYRPKGNSLFEHLTFVWQNWLASCSICNGTKWVRFPDCEGLPCLIDPASEDPREHISFLRHDVVSKTHRGEETIKLVGLDRSPLTDQRSEWLMVIDALLVLIAYVPDARPSARELLIWSMQPDAPYSAMAYCYLSEVVPKLANPEIPHPHIILQDPRRRITQLIEAYRDQLADME